VLQQNAVFANLGATNNLASANRQFVLGRCIEANRRSERFFIRSPACNPGALHLSIDAQSRKSRHNSPAEEKIGRRHSVWNAGFRFTDNQTVCDFRIMQHGPSASQSADHVDSLFCTGGPVNLRVSMLKISQTDRRRTPCVKSQRRPVSPVAWDSIIASSAAIFHAPSARFIDAGAANRRLLQPLCSHPCCYSGFQRRLGLRAAVASSSLPTTVVDGACLITSGVCTASSAIRRMMAMKASRVSLLSVLVGSIIKASSTMSGK